MTESRFSRLHGFENAPEQLGDTELPEWVRDEVFYLTNRLAISGRDAFLRGLFTSNLAHSLRPIQRRYMENAPITNPSQTATLASTRFYISTLEFHAAFDICQVIYRALLDVYGADIAGQFTLEINKVFDETGVGWRMDGADFERVMGRSTEDSIAATQAILVEPRFQGPNEQFNLAIKQFNQRPEANYKDCITNAIESVEGVVRIVTGQQSGVLSALLNREPLKSRIHPTLRQTLQKLYAYRGDVTSHGQTGVQGSFYGAEEAEFVLGMCASSIEYLSKKFPNSESQSDGEVARGEA